MKLFDHGAMWKKRNGMVFCTAMPYGNHKSIEEYFYQMVKEFNFPQTIKLEFLDDIYKYRSSGNVMIAIYCELPYESCSSECSIENLYEKAGNTSKVERIEYQANTLYNRDKSVSEYAKRQANGFCQLCGNPAPFKDKNQRPYLEAHHIIWLADGGGDAINNVVGLCPNCHRKMYQLNLEEDINKLLKIASC